MALSRADKPSPHSSPRLSRRSITSVPSTQSQNDIYSGQQQQQQHNNQPIQITTTASTSMHSINGNTVAPSTNHNNNKIETNNKTCMAQQIILNRMSAPMLPSSSSSSITQSAAMTKVLNKAFSADTAPPLPPRKSTSAQINAINANIVSSASSLVNLVNPTNVSSTNLSRSSENITCCDFDVPKCNPPPIPKHQNQNHNKPPLLTPIECISNDFKNIEIISSSPPSNEDNTLEDDKIIVGPAETITGIIDTRPIEARKPIIVNENEKTNSNNVYHMKSATNQQNHIRHQSFSTNNTSANNKTTPTKSVTIPNFGVQEITGEIMTTTNSTVSMVVGDSSSTPLLYENVTIAKKDCKEPYENVNLEYTARLMSEGYSQDNVRLALGISRNNIEMACDILHGFVSKSGA